MAIEVRQIMQSRDYASFSEFISFIKTGEVSTRLTGQKKIRILYILLAFGLWTVFSGLWTLIPVIVVLFTIGWQFQLFRIVPQSIHYKNYLKEKMLRDAEESFSKFIGKQVKYKNTTIGFSKAPSGKISGYGIAYDNSIVYIMQHGLAAKIPWSEIRKWNWNIEGYTSTAVYGGSLASNTAGNMTASLNNAHAKWDAYMNSGFFISVADIDHPKWQYMTDDEKTLTKWMEIFNQVNEGKAV